MQSHRCTAQAGIDDTAFARYRTFFGLSLPSGLRKRRRALGCRTQSKTLRARGIYRHNNPENFFATACRCFGHSRATKAGQSFVVASFFPSGVQRMSITGSRLSHSVGCSVSAKHSCSFTCTSGDSPA